jgi:AhpD family alkylhydroperoxidase
MAIVKPLNYAEAPAQARAVFDDIKATRGLPDVNNFWKSLAHDPATLERIWANLKQVMAPGALDPLTKEMIYTAVSIANGCEYCTASHTAAARAKGMSEAMLGELVAVVAMACQTNALAQAYRPEIDPQFRAT